MNILIQGNTHTIISQFQIENKLANAFYRLGWDGFGNISIEKIETPTLPEKYVDMKKNNRDIILKAFKASNSNLGVAFMGIKGTGKSVDAKMLSIEAELPVIIIDKQVPKSIDLAPFLLSIEQEIVVFIDEFGKNFKSYADEEDKYQTQENLLSILDGINSSYKRLFVFTTNENLNDFMVNRPSRIKFLVNYEYLKIEEIKLLLKGALYKEEYLQDLLDNLDNSNLTIDILYSIVNLINTVDKPYSQFKDIFNYSINNTYEFTPVEEGKGNFFMATVKGDMKKGKSVNITDWGYYRIDHDSQIKIDGDMYTYKKSFVNLTKVF